eukprot:6207183-Pleurochrysis_carterae.AAC.1
MYQLRHGDEASVAMRIRLRMEGGYGAAPVVVSCVIAHPLAFCPNYSVFKRARAVPPCRICVSKRAGAAWTRTSGCARADLLSSGTRPCMAAPRSSARTSGRALSIPTRTGCRPSCSPPC